jgi:hypothetical protein
MTRRPRGLVERDVPYRPLAHGHQGGQLPRQAGKVAGCVPGYVLRVLWAHLRQPNPLPENR